MPISAGALLLLVPVSDPIPAGDGALARVSSAPRGEVWTTEFRLPELGATVFDVRRGTADGGVERLGLDAAGRAVDVDALRRAERELAAARRGKLASDLSARTASAAPFEPIEVAFWLVEPDDGLELARWIRAQVAGVPKAERPSAVRAARAAALELNEQRLAPIVGAFLELVASAGGEVIESGRGWPIAIARLDAARVSAVAASALVDRAYASQPAWLPEGDWAQGTLRTFNVLDDGVTANGNVRVMVNDVGSVEPGHPWLPPIVPLTSAGIDSHGTSVAGNIANTHPLYHAAAYTLPELYSAPGDGDSAAPGVWQLAIQNGVDLGNVSWWNFQKGSIQFLDRFFDYTIRNFSVMLFKSNGNQGGTSNPACTTPGCGYNMISVGSYSDQNSWDWAGDPMAGSSSYANPIEGHEKPELATPGDCVATTTTGGSITSCFNGTSSASPLACGVGALLCSYETSLLAQMTTLKAAMMVSAWHNVDGDPLLSDRDGAGGVVAKAAYALLRDQQTWFQDVTAADFPGGVLELTVPLLAGEETRLIALWFSAADAAYTSDVLQMDLDLRVLDPNGVPVAGSFSALNPFELVSFTPAQSGNYRVRLTRQKFLGTSEPLSVAWSTKNDAGTAEMRLTSAAPFAVGESPRFLLRERYTGPGKPYLAWGALSGAPGQPISGGYTMPIGYDPVSDVVLATPGFAGVLPPSGAVAPQLPIPDLPFLAGTTVRFALAVFDAGGAVVEQVSDPLVLTILP